MRKNIWNKILSTVLAAAMILTVPAAQVFADGETPGKYVSDVYMAYAKTEEDAVKWLKDNGWEPISGSNDFNAGKASFWDNSAGHRDNVAVAMGIRRTNLASNAITDMAVMNMTGGYSFPDYESLLNEKKGEIDEFINTFLPVIWEFRENFNGNGSEFGKRRAELANMILNKYYDGEPGAPEAANDTGMPIGDLLRTELRQEGNASGGDLQQILLESSGAAVLLIEQMLALASDSGQESWIERLQAQNGDAVPDSISEYEPDNESQNLAPSAEVNLLKQRYGDAAAKIALGWTSVHQDIQWFENYNNSNDLWQHDGEEDDAYAERVNGFFEAVKSADAEEYKNVIDQYTYAFTLYYGLYSTEYDGEWGETLGDFFNPADGIDYSLHEEYFLPFAAAMSPGQRASLDLVSLSSLLLVGMGEEEALEQAVPDINEMFGDKENLSIYSGINRSIFRGGVAITSEALMEQNMGRGNAFDRIWDHVGIVSIVSYVSAAVGAGLVIASATMILKSAKTERQFYIPKEDVIATFKSQRHALLMDQLDEAEKIYWTQVSQFGEASEAAEANVTSIQKEISEIQKFFQKNKEKYHTEVTTYEASLGARTMLAIGGILLIGAGVLKAIQLSKYYGRKFTQIPLMIVDESDIVTWLTDAEGKPLLGEDGKQLKNVDFKDYEYYSAVRCNRQEAGGIGDPQDGVDDYVEWGCGDVADLNADMGQEWLALYTVKSPNKGMPILADSLKLQYGSDAQPEGTTKCLHFFEYTYPMDLGDTAYAYNNKKDGVYFFWDEDVTAENSQTASVFTAGHLAMAGVGGLILGVLCATLVLLSKRKKETEE